MSRSRWEIDAVAIWPWKKTVQTDERLISREQAIDHVRAYAAANGKSVQEPFYFEIQGRQITPDGAAAPVKRPVYLIRLGSTRPASLVEVDAIEGTVLAWRIFPR